MLQEQADFVLGPIFVYWFWLFDNLAKVTETYAIGFISFLTAMELIARSNCLRNYLRAVDESKRIQLWRVFNTVPSN